MLTCSGFTEQLCNHRTCLFPKLVDHIGTCLSFGYTMYLRDLEVATVNFKLVVQCKMQNLKELCELEAVPE